MLEQSVAILKALEPFGIAGISLVCTLIIVLMFLKHLKISGEDFASVVKDNSKSQTDVAVAITKMGSSIDRNIEVTDELHTLLKNGRK